MPPARAAIQRDIPALAKGHGLAYTVTLSDNGQGITTTANGLDRWVTPTGLETCKLPSWIYKTIQYGGNLVAAIIDVTFVMGYLGTGGASGSFTFRIVKNDDTTNGIVASQSIAYNASTLYAQQDVRDVTQRGFPVYAGDNLRLDVTAVPGSISGGGTGLKAHLTMIHFGVRG